MRAIAILQARLRDGAEILHAKQWGALWRGAAHVYASCIAVLAVFGGSPRFLGGSPRFLGGRCNHGSSASPSSELVGLINVCQGKRPSRILLSRAVWSGVPT